jgi:hypothetical protein
MFLDLGPVVEEGLTAEQVLSLGIQTDFLFLIKIWYRVGEMSKYNILPKMNT